MRLPTASSRSLGQAVALTYLVIVLGGVVRLSGAGLACPDWPLCHGRILPPADPLVWAEWLHRLAALLLVLLLVTLYLGGAGPGPAGLRRWLAAALGLLLVQVILGGLTVLLELPPAIVVAHLAASQLLLGVLVAAWVLSRGHAPLAEGPRKLAGVAVGLLLALILSGGWVTGSLAQAACGDWPLCRGQLLPLAAEPRLLIHVLHRGLAVAAGLSLFLLWRRVRAAAAGSARRLATAAFHLFWVQALIGGGYILTGYGVWLAGLHLAAAAALWGLVVALWARLRPATAAAER